MSCEPGLRASWVLSRSGRGCRSARRIAPLRSNAVAEPVGQALDEGSVHVHDIDVLLARAIGAEGDEVAVRAEVRVLVIALILGEALDIGSVRIHDEDVETVIEP